MERLMTDEWPLYQGIADHDTTHETDDGSAVEWVHGDVHTQTIESVVALQTVCYLFSSRAA